MEQFVVDVTVRWFVGPFLVIGSIGIIVALAHYLFRSTPRLAEISRKVVHVSSGIAFALGSYSLTKEQMIFACVLMAGGLIAASVLRLPLVMESVPRITVGAAAFPLGLAVATTLFYNNLDAYRFAVLALGICDATAALVGTNIALGRFTIFGQRKSLAGFLGCFVSAYALAFICGFGPVMAIGVAASIAVVETLFVFGLDNLFIPIVAGALFTTLL